MKEFYSNDADQRCIFDPVSKPAFRLGMWQDPGSLVKISAKASK